MAIVVFKVIALIFQRIERLICNFPPRPSSPHELRDVTLTHPQVRYPTAVLDPILAALPVLDDIDPYVRSRGIERYVVHKAKPMHNPCGAVVPLIIAHAPSVFRRLHLIAQRGMIAFFDPEDRVTTVIVEGLDVGGIGTQGVFGDDELEMRVILASLGNEAFGGMAFTIIFLRAILFDNRFGHEWNHFTLVWMDDRCTQHLVVVGDRPVSVLLLKTRGTVNRLGGKISRAIQSHQVVAIQQRHRFKRLASLELPKDARKRRP